MWHSQCALHIAMEYQESHKQYGLGIEREKDGVGRENGCAQSWLEQLDKLFYVLLIDLYLHVHFTD